jgi:hypothetical protein
VLTTHVQAGVWNTPFISPLSIWFRLLRLHILEQLQARSKKALQSARINGDLDLYTLDTKKTVDPTVSAELLDTSNDLFFCVSSSHSHAYYITPNAEASIPSGQYLFAIFKFVEFVPDRPFSCEVAPRNR